MTVVKINYFDDGCAHDALVNLDYVVMAYRGPSFRAYTDSKTGEDVYHSYCNVLLSTGTNLRVNNDDFDKLTGLMEDERKNDKFYEKRTTL